VFATFSTSQSDTIGTVVIWGSMPQDTFDQLLTNIRGTRNDFNGVSYKEIPKDSLMPQLVAAIAAGTGPDLYYFLRLLCQRWQQTSIHTVIVWFQSRAFQSTFVQSGEIFLTATGATALPITVDPLCCIGTGHYSATQALPNLQNIGMTSRHLRQSSPKSTKRLTHDSCGSARRMDNVSSARRYWSLS